MAMQGLAAWQEPPGPLPNPACGPVNAVRSTIQVKFEQCHVVVDRIGTRRSAKPTRREQGGEAVQRERSADQLLHGRSSNSFGRVLNLHGPFGGDHIDASVGTTARK